MFVIHVLINLTIVTVEIALAVAIGWLAWQMPLVLAATTGALAVLLGLRLEVRRLAFEMPFYFERTSGLGRIVRVAIGSGQALFKALIAGIVALMIFAGTETERLKWIAVIFGVTVLVGSAVLRRLTISFGARPAHWGFFRMAAPLGLLFSAAMSFFPAPTSLDVARRVLIDLPARPDISQAGEALFALRLWIDDLIVRLLAGWVGPDWAKLIAIAVGSNVLAGFVIAIYAVILSEVVRTMEEAHWRLRRCERSP